MSLDKSVRVKIIETNLHVIFYFGECIKIKKNEPQLSHQFLSFSFHVGNECQEPGAFSATIREARTVVDKAREFGFEIKLLDIGGGYPGHWSSLSLFKMVSTFILNS